MLAIAVNGSPRKKWNTSTLLEKTLQGAAGAGAETRMVHLYDLNYQGCKSCFACKLKGGVSYGRCAVDDALNPVLRQIEEADVLVLGSPIYYGMVTGEMRSFIERLLFPYLVYDAFFSSLRKKKTAVGLIYTMNTTEAGAADRNYQTVMAGMEGALRRTLGREEFPALYVTDTCQFDDYSKYEVTAYSGEQKEKRRAEEFPNDCRKAFDLGGRLVHAAGR